MLLNIGAFSMDDDEEEEEEKGQLAMHCHLRPPVPPVVLGFNHKAHNAQAYQISTKLHNAMMCY